MRKCHLLSSVQFSHRSVTRYMYDSLHKLLTVNKRVHKVAFLLTHTLVVSTSTSLKSLSNTAHPRLWRGSLSESVLHAVTWKRFGSVGSWPAFTVTLDTKVRVVLHRRRLSAPREIEGVRSNSDISSQQQCITTMTGDENMENHQIGYFLLTRNWHIIGRTLPKRRSSPDRMVRVWVLTRGF